jgi:type II secretory pathway pseudopilin PulG
MPERMTSQDGVALPVASGMLLVISILVVGFFSVALRANDTSVDDRSSKRALAAAEAGLQTAVYRLNQLNQTDPAVRRASCLTTTWVTPTAGQCPGLTESLGNGAQYTYYVTHEGGAAGCVQVPGVAPDATLDRCITSIGTVNGVSRRIQTRVISRPLIPDFNLVGLIGKSLVYAWNSANLNTDVGSNVRVFFDNSVNVNEDDSIDVNGTVLLLQGGTYEYQNSVTVDGGTQTITTPFEMPLPDFEAVEQPTGNNNINLLTDLGTAWDPITRHINIDSGTKTIGPGTYHVCGVHLGNSVNLRFSHTGNQRTRIFVDSPSRPGSYCAGPPPQADPAGTFTADNSVMINKEDGEREELLDIYMYGTSLNDTRTRYDWCQPIHSPVQPNECKSDFMLDNSVEFYGAVYSPNSTIQAHNSAKIFGAVASDKILFFNSVDFTLTGDMKNRPSEAPGAATRKGWKECQGQPSVPSDPESGC